MKQNKNLHKSRVTSYDMKNFMIMKYAIHKIRNHEKY